MEKPLISIITVSLNSHKTIERTIKSIIEQGYDRLEYIIIDGGSTDGTTDIIKNYREHISYYTSEKDDGISSAFNKGVEHAHGDIICIINSDDILLPGALDAVAAVFDEEIDIYRGNVIIWNEDSDKKWREIPSIKFPRFPLVIHVAHQGTFITKRAYEKWGLYDTKFKFMMDFDLLTRYYRKGAAMKYVDYDIAQFTLGGTSTSSIRNKRYDILHVISNNGGSHATAYCFYAYMSIVHYAKCAFIRIFGLDHLKSLHYMKNQH